MTFFCNNSAVGEEGITPGSLSNAPFYYTEISGDFVMRVKVSLDFKDTYDSSSIMVMQDSRNWEKACRVYENLTIESRTVKNIRMGE